MGTRAFIGPTKKEKYSLSIAAKEKFRNPLNTTTVLT
jgi:hypothetical protein